MGRRRYRSAPLIPLKQGEKKMAGKKGIVQDHSNRPKTRPPYKKCRKLTLKQRKLVNEYFRNGGYKAAAMRSTGMGGKLYYHQNTWTTFNQPAVKLEIERRIARMDKKFELNEDWVIERFRRIADANTGDILMKLQDNDYDLSVLTSDERFAIEELSDEMELVGRSDDKIQVRKTKVKTKSNLQALNSLARKLGMFNDKVSITGEISLVDRIQAGRKRALDVEFEEVKEIEGEVA
jgi:hypothetical protein